MTDEEQVPTDEQLRLAMFQTMEQMFVHSKAQTEIILTLQARLAGAESVADVVDQNEEDAHLKREIEARKQIISHLFDKFKQYSTVIIAGAFAAYFTTLGALSERFTDGELILSALLMTASLFVFVTWEIIGVIFMGVHSIKGDMMETLSKPPRWQSVGWALAMFFSLATAFPAVGISLWVYLRRLGATQWLASIF